MRRSGKPEARRAYGAIGTVAASIDSRNRTSLARSGGLVSVSTPPVPALRCVTLSITCVERGGDAAVEERLREGVDARAATAARSRAAPSGGAAFCRTSLKSVGSNVPTCRSSPMSWPATTAPASGGGVKRTRLVVHCGPPWHDWQFAALKERAARDDVGLGLRDRRDRRADAELDEGLDRVPGADAAHLELVAAAARERQ